MKKTTLFKNLTLILISCCCLFGCVKDQDFSTPEVNCIEPQISSTNTIQQVKEMYRYGGPTTIETDVIIEGYVVSSDASGNIYKTLSIQDKPENPTAAIKIAIDQSDLYTKYNIGRKVFIKLKGLAIGYSFGSFQIGKAKENELERISLFELNDYLFRSCIVEEIIPKIISISELNESHYEMLIQIENAQFKNNELGNSYGNLDNSATVDRIVASFDSNCNYLGEIPLRISGYSDFKNELLPSEKGSITGVFSNYYDDFQLYIRNTEDVNLIDERCDFSENLKPTITLSEVREMFDGELVEFGVSKNYIVEGYVISSDANGNFQQKLVIQDATENPTSGMQLLLDDESIYEKFNVGDKIIVVLNKLYMNEIDGVLSIGIPNNNKLVALESSQISEHLFNTRESFKIVPLEISISKTNNKILESTLVKVNNIQLLESELGKAFAFFSGDNSASRIVETCNEFTKLSVFTNGKAAFANQEFPIGHGTIVGVLGKELKIRTINDIDFSEPFETCPVIIPEIMITEVADPINSVASRFIELYNAGETEINLQGWKINKYINGSSNVSGTPIDLNTISIPPKGFVIIANSDFATIFNQIPTIESSYISGNGDDVYELIDHTGKRIDMYGVIGEDGNGTNWEYLDGRAVRNLDILAPNNTFNINEWTVYSNASNNLISHPNSPKYAPNDYDPNYR